jgi:hypothetical protein
VEEKVAMLQLEVEDVKQRLTDEVRELQVIATTEVERTIEINRQGNQHE